MTWPGSSPRTVRGISRATGRRRRDLDLDSGRNRLRRAHRRKPGRRIPAEVRTVRAGHHPDPRLHAVKAAQLPGPGNQSSFTRRSVVPGSAPERPYLDRDCPGEWMPGRVRVTASRGAASTGSGGRRWPFAGMAGAQPREILGEPGRDNASAAALRPTRKGGVAR